MKRRKITSPEYARRKKVTNRLTVVVLGANIIGAVLAIQFYNLGYNLVVEESATNTTSFWGSPSLLYVPILLVLGVVISNWYARPLDRWYGHPDPAKAGPPSRRVQQLALNSSFGSAMISFAMWFVAGVVEFILNHAIYAITPGTMSSAEIGGIALSLMGIAGPITAVLIYFTLDRLWSREIPLFFPDARLGEVKAFRLTVRRRLLFPSAMGVILMVVLALSTYTQAQYLLTDPRPEVLRALMYQAIYLVGIGVLVAAVLAQTLGRSLADNIETLRQSMTAVQQGKLDVQLPVTSNDEIGDLTAGFNAMVKGLQQEEIVRRLFSLYVTPEVAEHAIKYGAELGGQLTEATVLFSDIRGFTSMTELLGPDAIIALLNRYFDAMSAAVIAHGGLVNKFGGDSLLAVFGTPLNPAKDHAARAVHAARAMLAAMAGFNMDQVARGEPTLRIGIGIATGLLVAGNVGGEERLEYTVIGDTVNLASRLESLTKDLDTMVLVSGTTVEIAPECAEFTPMGEVTVRGKQKPSPVYTFEYNAECPEDAK